MNDINREPLFNRLGPFERIMFVSKHICKLIRDIKLCEVVKLERNKPPRTSAIISNNDYPAFCNFEYVYFSKPDSIIENQMVYTV